MYSIETDKVLFGETLRQEIVKALGERGGSTQKEIEEYFGDKNVRGDAIKYALAVLYYKGILVKRWNLQDMRQVYYILSDSKDAL